MPARAGEQTPRHDEEQTQLEIATEPKTAANLEIPEGVAVTKQEAERTKRGKGRPPKPFISEFPKPPKFEMQKPEMLFEYLRSIPADKLARGMLVFYRFHPIVDATEGGTKDKMLEKIPCENHPFVDEDWEAQILHRYGSGTYAVYLNEMNRTVCRCMKIETRWDLENYPPIIDPQWVDQDIPQNRAYVQYLRSKGTRLPNKEGKEQEDNEMQLADTISKLTDTVIAQSNRASIPIPQMQPQPSMSEKLNFEMASKAIDAFSEKMKVEVQSGSQQNNGLELVDKLVSVSERMNPRGDDAHMKLLMAEMMASRQEAAKRAEASEERSNRLIDKMLTQQQNPATQPKSLLDQMREMAEMRSIMKEAFGVGSSDDGEGKPEKQSFGELALQNAPMIISGIAGLVGQAQQTFASLARIKEMEAYAKTGQLPEGAKPPQMQPVQPMQTQQAPQPQAPNPQDTERVERERQEQIAYGQYHPLIGMIAQPLLTHLSDPGHVEDGEIVRKDGYDFASWFIDGQGPLMYAQVKAVGPDKLMGAIKSYAPLWQQIGGMEEKVQQFIGEFLTYEEFMAGLPKEGEAEITEN